MVTERRALRKATLLTAVLLVWSAPLTAQQNASIDARTPTSTPLFLIDSDTRIASLNFSFEDGEIAESRLRSRIAMSGSGPLDRLQRLLSWVPFVSAPPPEPFSPLVLQRDKIRLTRFLHRDGFPDARVAYTVVLDTLANAVDVGFVIAAGRPRVLDSLAVSLDESGGALPESVRRGWVRFVKEARSERGARLSETLEQRLRSRTLEWWRDHGYAFSQVSSTVDSLTTSGRRLNSMLTLQVEPGPLSYIGEVSVEGNRALSDRVILRELPFEVGDVFRSSELAEGQSQLFGLDLLRLALVGVSDSQAVDSTVAVQVRVEEGSLRTIEGLWGYSTEEGISADASWSHRDFTGAARRLTVTAQARTGWWSGARGPNASYNLSTTLRQPWLGDYRVSGFVSPYVEFRDDERDRSAQVGLDATVLWERGPLRTMSLSYGYSRRSVSQARGGALTGVSDFIGFLQALDTLNADVRTSGVRYAATWGEVDDPIDPRSGWFARVGAEVSGPAGWANVEYGRLNGGLRGFLPLGQRGAVVLKANGGHLIPFGKSIPTGDNQTQVFLRLRDGLFTGGGTQDVRGWGSDQLGPKVPDIEVRTQGDSLVFGGASRYVPLGGTDRWSGSVELQLPMPFTSGPFSVHAFLDAGRVWTSDDRFVDPNEPTLLTLDDQTFFGTGAGVQLGTPVGPLRLSLAYKLNPGVLDIRDPTAVAQALLSGSPLTEIEEENIRRWQLHLSIGRAF